jgi:hypothetical protein
LVNVILPDRCPNKRRLFGNTEQLGRYSNGSQRRLVWLCAIQLPLRKTVQRGRGLGANELPGSDWIYINPRSVPRYEPSLEKIGCRIKQFLNVCRVAPVTASQSHTVSPSREKTTALAQLVWPSSVCRGAPVAASQNRAVWSSDADFTVLPSPREGYSEDPIHMDSKSIMA